MSIVIIKRPDRNNVNDPSVVSRWVCSRNPIYFELDRRDITYNGISENAGLCVITTNDVNAAAMQNGEIIYVRDVFGNYDQVCTADVVYHIAGVTTIYTNMPYTLLSVSGIINRNSLRGYNVTVLVKLVNKITNNTFESNLIVTPSTKGNIKLYVQDVITAFLKKELSVDYTFRNILDKNVFGTFTLKYTEQWLDDNGNVFIGQVIDDGIVYWFGDCSKYLLDEYGGNLADYLPINDNTIAKFLTGFSEPVYFSGYPFTIGFIYPTELSGVPLLLKETRKDLNGNTIGTGNRSLDVAQVGGINLLRLIEGYADNVDFVDIFLENNGIVQQSYFEESYISDSYYELIPPTPTSYPTFPSTETKRIAVAHPCGVREIYVRWRNRLASWDYWLFDTQQNVTDETNTLGTFDKEPDELENATTRMMSIDKEIVNSFTLLASVQQKNYQGMKQIISSPCVQVLVDKANNKWINVQVTTKQLKYNSAAAYVDVAIEIEFPKFYSISN